MTEDCSPSTEPAELGCSLPASVTSFIGRDEQLAELVCALQRSRLVTLTGAPGIGKSRLALELARRLEDTFPDGARVVELAGVGHAERLSETVARAVQLPELPRQSRSVTLFSRLRGRKLLLVLDNCEHLIGACADFADALLAACPETSILATSTEPLAIAGELLWPVPPLSVPASKDAWRPDELAAYDGVSLFVERAQSVQPAFKLNAYVAPQVAEICKRLDGLPLAIELAASLSAMLTPAEIVRRLDDRFSLLTRGSRSELPRHQTLAAALDWSHELLSAEEQVLLRRLSVFAGGFCLEACETVCGVGEVSSSDVFDLLARLVSRSLVVADTVNGARSRYSLLETVRAYAGDRLEEASEAADLREAHARFYLDYAERAEPELAGPDQIAWLARLETDQANLRSALEWSLGHGRSDWALRLSGALVLFWRVRCHFREGRALLADAVAAGNGAQPALKAKAQWGLGFLTHMTGDDEGAMAVLEQAAGNARAGGDSSVLARALMILGDCKRTSLSGSESPLPLLEESVELARESCDSWCLSHALGVTGFVFANREEAAVARTHFDEAVAVARESGESQGLRYGLYGLGIVAGDMGDFRSAEPRLEEAVELMEELGESYLKADALQWLAQAASARADYQRARELLDRCDDTYREFGLADPPAFPLVVRAMVARAEGQTELAGRLLAEAKAADRSGWNVLVLAQHLGEQALAEGEPEGARRMFEKALEGARSDGFRRGMAQALAGLGDVARRNGDEKRAAALHNEALGLHHQIGNAKGVATSLVAVAGLATAAGRFEHAARLFAAAEAMGEHNGFSLPSEAQEADRALIRDALSPEQLELAWSQGRGLSPDAAVAQASKGRGTRARGATGWSSLTDSERQVAALVAEGLTNPEIAERMFVSLGTVKAHLSHIFQKLGITKRRELAREVLRHGRAEADLGSDPFRPRPAPDGKRAAEK